MTRKNSLGFIKLRPPASPEGQSLLGPIWPCYQGQFEYYLVQILAIKLWPQKNTIFDSVVTIYFRFQRKFEENSFLEFLPWENNSSCPLRKASQMALGVMNLPANAGDIGDTGSIPRLGRFPGGGLATHSSSLAWRIPVDRGAWQATVYGVAKSRTWLSD